MSSKNIISVGLMVGLLSSCAQDGSDSGLKKQDVGAIAGAVTGALVAGNNIGKGKGNTLAIAAGTLLGGYLGQQIGASLDRADMAYYHKTSQTALERNKTGEASTWMNPDSGHSGTVTPTRTYQLASGQYCREYTQTITVGGKNEEAFGKACRQPDGAWKIVQ